MRSSALLLLGVLPLAAGCGNRDRSHETTRASLAEPGSEAAALPPAPPSLPSGLDTAERARFYHQPIGTETLPLALLRALDSSVTHRRFFDGLARFGMLRDPDPANTEQLPVGMSLQPADEQHPLAMVGVTCSACHVREIRLGAAAIRIDGAPSTFDVHALFSEALASVRATLESPRAALEFIARFRRESNGKDLSRINAAVLSLTCPGCDEAEIDRRVGDQIAWLAPRPPRPELQSRMARSPEGQEALARSRRSLRDRLFVLKAYFVHLQRIADRPAASAPGPGRCDPLAGARDLLAPDAARSPLEAISDIPALWGSATTAWVGRAGDTAPPLARDLAVVLGSGAAWDRNTFASTVRASEIAGAERLAEKIASPAWPEDVLGKIDERRAERGEALFEKHCARCHAGSSAAARGDDKRDDSAGTDPLRAALLGRKIGDRPLSDLLGEALGRLEARAGAARSPGGGAVGWPTRGRYLARPLTGAWATAPYLHNGSVPTLFDLLQPAARRPRTFVVGGREYDPVKLGLAVAAREQAGAERAPAGFTYDTSQPGNSNAGHEFGTRLPDTDKRDLLEYLKRL